MSMFSTALVWVVFVVAENWKTLNSDCDRGVSVRKMAFTRWNKIWVAVALCSLLAYDIRWLVGSSVSVYNVLSGSLSVSLWWRFWLDYVLTGLVGNVVRLIGVFLALYAVYLVWGSKKMAFASVRKKVAVALLCEAAYFLVLLPITLIEVGRGYLVLMAGFILQILMVSPALTALSRKVWLYTEPAQADLPKWVAVASVSYLAGIWVVNVFRWFGMTEYVGTDFVLSGITAVGFLNTVVTLSLAVVFGVAGFHAMLKKKDRKRIRRLFALALIMLGSYFAVFLLYSAITNTLGYAVLVEIWPVTLLGLGLSMLKGDT
jgi:hypothetical protein